MSDDIGELLVSFKADLSGLSEGISKAKEQIGGVAATAEHTSGSFLGSFAHMGASVLDFTAKIGQTVFGVQQLAQTAIGLGSAMLEPNAQLEQAKVAFTSLFHSSKQAGDYLKELQNFAAATPFEFPQLEHDAQLMKAFQFQTKEIIPDLTNIGDAISALGGSAATVDQVVQVFGQMHASTHIQTQDLMQLTSVGINGFQILADQMGKPVATIKDMVSKGLVPAKVGIDDLMKGMHETFGGGMQAQSETFNGLLSTFKDNIRMAWVEFSGPLFDKAKQGLEKLGTLVSSKPFQDFARTLSGDVAGALDKLNPLFDALGQSLDSVFAPAQKVHDVVKPLIDTFDHASGIIHSTTTYAKPLIDTFDRGKDIFEATTQRTKPMVDSFDRGRSIIADMSKKFGEAHQTVNPLVQIFKDLTPLVSDLVGFFQNIAGTVETFGSNVMDAVEHSGALHAVLQTIHDILPDVETFFSNVADALSKQLLPPVLSLVQNFSTWLDKSGILKDGLKFLGDQVQNVAGFVGGLVGDLSNLFGWLDQNQGAAYALKDAFFAVGGVIAGIKIIQFGKDVFNTLKDAKQNVTDFIGTLGKIKDTLGDVVKFFTGKFKGDSETALGDVGKKADSASGSVADIGAKAKTSATDVTAAAKTEEADLSNVGKEADAAATGVTGIGKAADETKIKVATDAQGMGNALATDVDAGATKADLGVEGIAVAGAATEAKVGAEAAGMEGALAGVLSEMASISMGAGLMGMGGSQVHDSGSDDPNLQGDLQKEWGKLFGGKMPPQSQWSSSQFMAMINAYAKDFPQYKYPFGISGRAQGGFVKVGEPFMFNEQGPELGIATPSGVQVYSHTQSMNMLDGLMLGDDHSSMAPMYGGGGSGGNEYHFHIEVGGQEVYHAMTRDSGFIDAVGNGMHKQMHRVGPVGRAR